MGITLIMVGMVDIMDTMDTKGTKGICMVDIMATTAISCIITGIIAMGTSR